MAMNGDVLGLAMLAAVNAVGDKTDRAALFKAIGGAIVAHITSQATVAVAVASVSLVTSGTSASGPGSGTGTIS